MARGNSKKARKLPSADLEKVEADSIHYVNMTISALESAMAAWEAAKAKPEDLRAKYVRYRLIHEILSRWQTKALRGMKAATYSERTALLWELVDICDTYLQEW